MSWVTDVARTTLSNGLTVLVQRAPSAPVVAVVTHVRAGYFDEPDEWVGIAHVLEHMFFKGTARRGPGDIARETQLVGGYINAGTIYDKTVYYTVLPSSQGGLRQALDVQADALRNAAIDPDELARELEVIIQEAKRKLDTPAAVTYETLLEVLFPTHRIRRWRIGTEDGLRHLTRDDVVRYYETRYTPDRVIVSVVGDIEQDEALELIDQHYGDWARPSGAIGDPAEETQPVTPSMRLLSGDVMRPRAMVGWRTVDALHPDTPALDAAAGILGSGRGAHLYRRLRRTGLASSTSADHYTPTVVGTLTLGFETEVQTFDDAVEAALGSVASLAEGSASEADVARVHALMQTRWLSRLESMEGRASLFCEAEALGGIELVDRFYEQFLDVTREQVMDVAERYLTLEGVCAVGFMPEGAETGLHTGWPPTPNGADAVRRITVPEVPSGGSIPPLREIREVAKGIFHVEHDNVDFITREKRGSGLVTLGLHFPGVPTKETAANAGISSLFVRSAVRGAGGLSSEELAEVVERLGGTLGSSVRADYLGWWITVPVKRAVNAASLLRLVAEQPNLNSGDVGMESRYLASDVRRAQDDMFAYPIDRVLGLAFRDHAYGLPALGTVESVERLDHASVRSWATRVLTHRPVVVGVGDLSVTALADALGPLADWPSVQSGPVLEFAPTICSEQDSTERRKQQTALAMAFPAFAYDSPRRYALTVTGSLLSGLAGRLFDELRERRSLAYTVAALPWLGRMAGVMLTYIATSPEREREARDAMHAELRRVVTAAPDDSELERAKNYAAGGVEMRLQNGRSMADEVLNAWIKGSIADVPEVAQRLRSVSIKDVVEVANEVFTDPSPAEFVVRGIGPSAE